MADPATPAPEITLAVEGFKAIRDRVSLAIRPLTLLAGANSSGKSSFFQVPLLLKQTLESSFDPGGLLLNGPHVQFTDPAQVFWRGGEREFKFYAALSGEPIELVHEGHGLNVGLAALRIGGDELTEWREDSSLAAFERDGILQDPKLRPGQAGFQWIGDRRTTRALYEIRQLLPLLRSILHVPGVRGQRQRSFPYTGATGPHFPGPFTDYTASLLARWGRANGDAARLSGAAEDLATLGLSSAIDAQILSAAEVRVRVERLLGSGPSDLVDIADVGFGVSTVLPVVAALHAANPGQLVYLEQPEQHLHPRAQIALGTVLLRAARRGVRVVAETHSNLLVKAVRLAVANDPELAPLVALHWFQRDPEGVTRVRSADLDAQGRFGDWPADFDEVELEMEDRLLDAMAPRKA